LHVGDTFPSPRSTRPVYHEAAASRSA